MSSSAAQAQSSLHYLGQAVGGQQVNIDLNSISRVSARSVDFTYYLGNDERYSQANCGNGTWTTFEDGVVHSPQSATTAEMVRLVCNGGYSYASETIYEGTRELSWLVFAPPSNVRTSPNGSVQCTIRSISTVNVYGRDGDWAITDACGSRGYIHNSQLEPID
ncbi:hypothetical protein H6F95_28850 [Cyanobacteria bacterium FACHB-471]|nr:hypothetical protein [Cyanobacteria bacterium FACHB-471]